MPPGVSAVLYTIGVLFLVQTANTTSHIRKPEFQLGVHMLCSFGSMPHHSLWEHYLNADG
jgi:hypothetical protein